MDIWNSMLTYSADRSRGGRKMPVNLLDIIRALKGVLGDLEQAVRVEIATLHVVRRVDRFLADLQELVWVEAPLGII